MRQIILASISPRRLQLIKLLNIKFKQVESGYDEIVPKGLKHEDVVKFLALGKAQAAAKKYPKALIITADTMVSFKSKIIGKPKNPKEATQMLKAFSGRSHFVITGLVGMDARNGRTITELGKCKIYFKKLSKKVIKSYVDSKEPFDKAGGYNLQGGGFTLIEKIEGDFTNLLGLPMGKVFNALQKLGVNI